MGPSPNQKTMSLWQHQGRLMYGTPNISRPATAGENSLPLSWHVLSGVRLLTAPQERAAGNLQKPAAFDIFVGSFHEMYNCTKYHTGSAVARVTKDHAARPHLSENQLLERRRQLLTIGQWNVMTLLGREATDRPQRRTALVAMELAKTISTSPAYVKQGSQSQVVSTTWNNLSSGMANPKVKQGRLKWTLLSKRTSLQS